MGGQNTTDQQNTTQIMEVPEYNPNEPSSAFTEVNQELQPAVQSRSVFPQQQEHVDNAFPLQTTTEAIQENLTTEQKLIEEEAPKTTEDIQTSITAIPIISNIHTSTNAIPDPTLPNQVEILKPQNISITNTEVANVEPVTNDEVTFSEQVLVSGKVVPEQTSNGTEIDSATAAIPKNETHEANKTIISDQKILNSDEGTTMVQSPQEINGESVIMTQEDGEKNREILLSRRHSSSAVSMSQESTTSSTATNIRNDPTRFYQKTTNLVLNNLPIGTRLFIGNLPSHSTTTDELMEIFAPYGDILQISIKNSYGFVQYDNVESVKKAIEMENGRTLHGLRLGNNSFCFILKYLSVIFVLTIQLISYIYI